MFDVLGLVFAAVTLHELFRNVATIPHGRLKSIISVQDLPCQRLEFDPLTGANPKLKIVDLTRRRAGVRHPGYGVCGRDLP